MPDSVLVTILAAFLSFGLGVLATLITQALARRRRLGDAKRKRNVEKLQPIQLWVDSYRKLFQCRYPDIFELVFSHKYLAPNYRPFTDRDRVDPVRIYTALQEYQEVRALYDIAELQGVRALRSLEINRRARSASSFWDSILHREPLFIQIARFETYFSPPPGLEGLGYALGQLYADKEYIFERFPDRFCQWIRWDRLSQTAPEDVRFLIGPRFPQKEYPRPPRNFIPRSAESLTEEMIRDSDTPENIWSSYWKGYRAADTWSEEETDLVDAFESVRGRKSSAASFHIERALDELERFRDQWLWPLPE